MGRAAAMRLVVIHLLQLPAVALVMVSPQPAAWWCAAAWGSIVTCAGTDSGWRWRNRMLVAEAVVWLSLALTFAL